MGLIYRTSSLANVGASSIKNAELTYEEGDGNIAFLLTNLSGSNVSIQGNATLSGPIQLNGNLQADGIVYMPNLTSASQNSVVTYDSATGRFYYTASSATISTKALLADTASFVTASNVYGPYGANSVISSSIATTASFVTASNIYGPHGSSSVLSSSFAVSASWAPSIATNTGSLLTTASISSNTITFTKGDGSTFPITVNTGSSTAAFPFTGSARITGSLGVTGSIATYSDDATDTMATIYSFSQRAYPLPRGYQRGDYDAPSFDSNNRYYQTAIPSTTGYFNTINTSTGGGRTIATYRGYLGIGTPGYELDTGVQNAQAIFMYTDAGTSNPASFQLAPVTASVIISDNKTLDISTGYTSVINARTANGRTHVLIVTGSFLSRDGVSLGTNINNTHIITGSVNVTGSLVVNGTSQASIIAGKQPSGTGGAVVGSRVLVNNFTIYSILPGGTSTERANFPYLRTGGLGGNQGDGTFTYYYQDLNIGYENILGGTKAPSIKITRDQVGSDLDTAPYYTVISDNVTLADSAVTTFGSEIWRANGRAHVLTVATGSFLAREGVSLGTNISNRHIITGSVNITGSLNFNSGSAIPVKIQNGVVILSQVSSSLNFANDAAAAAGGVPLGGLYRNGNAISIRIV
jgi:hypothetical protein